MALELWLIRHGERVDQVSGTEGDRWRRSAACRERRYDPPLTQKGRKQARQVGVFLEKYCDDVDFSRIYTSPLLRAVETSIFISRELGGVPIQVLVGLCECASAIKRRGLEDTTFISDEEILRRYPGANVAGRDTFAPKTFTGVCQWLVSKPELRVLAVGHSEGTRKMAKLKRFSTPYCCIGRFSVKSVIGDTNNREVQPVRTLSYHLLQLLSSTGRPLYAPAECSLPEENAIEKVGGSENNLPLPVVCSNISVGLACPTLITAQDDNLGKVVESDNESRLHEGYTCMNNSKHKSQENDSYNQRGTDGFRRTSTKEVTCVSGAALVEVVEGAELSDEPDQSFRNVGSASILVENMQPSRESFHECSQTLNLDNADLKGQPARGSVPLVRRHVLQRASSRRTGGGCSSDVEGVWTCLTQSGKWHSCHSDETLFVGLCKLPWDVLCGTSQGILYYLFPRELCHVSSVSKRMGNAAQEDSLWKVIFLRLPEMTRRNVTQRKDEATLCKNRSNGLEKCKVDCKCETTTKYKTLFKDAIAIVGANRSQRVVDTIDLAMHLKGIVHGLRGALKALGARLSVEINGSLKGRAVIFSKPRTEIWAGLPNLLSTPGTRADVRTFTLSSSIKVALPLEGVGNKVMSVSDLHSLCVVVSLSPKLRPPQGGSRGVTLLRLDLDAAVSSMDVLASASVVGESADASVTVYDITRCLGDGCIGGIRVHGSCGVGSPSVAQRVSSCVLLGVLGKADEPDADIAFITVHVPHQLVLNRASLQVEDLPRNEGISRGGSEAKVGRQNCQDSGSVSLCEDGYCIIPPTQSLNRFSVALGLRTVGIPSWEAAVLDVNVNLDRLYPHLSHHNPLGKGPTIPLSRTTPETNHFTQGTDPLIKTALLEVVGPEIGNAGGRPSSISERALVVGPSMPYSTGFGLGGHVEGTLLMDLCLWNEDGKVLWSFTLPIRFSHVDPFCGPGDGMDEGFDFIPGSTHRMEGKEWVNMDLEGERREQRLHGSIKEPGVGSVTVELSLLECTTTDRRDGLDGGGLQLGGNECKSTKKKQSQWVVRRAFLELDLGFLNCQF